MNGTVMWFVVVVLCFAVIGLMILLLMNERDANRTLRADLAEKAAEPVQQGTETTEFPVIQQERGVLPFDENNPPKRMIYRGSGGKWTCTCHDQAVESGQVMWLWPRPDMAPDAMDLYCDTWIQALKES
jgi:hypothetical protein